MSNKNWNDISKDVNRELQGRQANAEDDDEFGEFEGAGHFEPLMARVLPQALQAGMSAWSTFPDYVPSQRTASSALQPDLLPMQASMHSSQMTDSNSSLGEAASIFDLPDDAASGGDGLVTTAAVGALAAVPLPDLSPSLDGAVPAGGSVQRSGHRRLPLQPVSVCSVQPGLVLPDVSSREEVTAPQGRVSLPDFRTNLNGGVPQGAIPRTRAGINGSLDVNVELGNSRNSSGSSPVSALEDQLTASRNLNQRLTTELEALRQRVRVLEDQLTNCQLHLQCPNRSDHIEAIVQEALQRQQNAFSEEIQVQITRLERTAASANMTEERITSLLRENSERQMTMLDARLEAFSDKVRSTLIDGYAGQCPAAMPNLETVFEKFANDQSKRQTETSTRILSCLEAIFSTGQQRLQTLLQHPHSRSPDSADCS